MLHDDSGGPEAPVGVSASLRCSELEPDAAVNRQRCTGQAAKALRLSGRLHALRLVVDAGSCGKRSSVSGSILQVPQEDEPRRGRSHADAAQTAKHCRAG